MLVRMLPGALLLLFCLACDGPFPAVDKPTIPSDHTSNQSGALHKGGEDNPFGSGGCSDSDCHQVDLRGGLVVFEGQRVVAPSCFQCHGARWEDDAPLSVGGPLPAHRSSPIPEMP